jgi:hypothetical protein
MSSRYTKGYETGVLATLRKSDKSYMLKLRHYGQINTYLRLQTLQYIDTAVRNFCIGLALPICITFAA